MRWGRWGTRPSSHGCSNEAMKEGWDEPEAPGTDGAGFQGLAVVALKDRAEELVGRRGHRRVGARSQGTSCRGKGRCPCKRRAPRHGLLPRPRREGRSPSAAGQCARGAKDAQPLLDGVAVEGAARRREARRLASCGLRHAPQLGTAGRAAFLLVQCTEAAQQGAVADHGLTADGQIFGRSPAAAVRRAMQRTCEMRDRS